MFSSEQILRSAVFAVIGGIIIVVVFKLLENEETAAPAEMEDSEVDDLNEANKQSREHDERLC